MDWKPYINVLGQDSWSFIRWNYWAPLVLPSVTEDMRKKLTDN